MAAGGTTDDPTPTVSGTGKPGDTIEVWAGAQAIGPTLSARTATGV